MSVEIRPLESWSEYRACERLQRSVWGEGFTELVPASILEITQRLGGVCSGAFDETGGLVGFVYGLTGLEDGRPIHWSHMLGVRSEQRGRGTGRALKRHQRERIESLGIGRCYWTYDPLMSANANINLNHFLVEVVEYVEDMYGDTGSSLHEGLGTDRFVVAWTLGPGAPDPFDPDEPARAARQAELERHAGAPVVRPGAAAEGDLPRKPAVRIAIPADILGVRTSDPAAALHWRTATRRAFQHYLAADYRVAGFLPPTAGAAEGHYVLVKEDRT